jgi:hypothetical protein
MAVKIWASDSEKTQACDIRREAKKAGKPIPSNAEIILLIQAKRAQQSKPPVNLPSSTPLAISAYPPGQPPGVSLPADLLQVVAYTAQATQICPTWRPADTIAYLKESKQINQTEKAIAQSAHSLDSEQLLALIKPDKPLPSGSSPSTSSLRPANSLIPSTTEP